MRYHGPGSPGGVALAFRALERGLPLLAEAPERREVTVRTAFGGPGARDGFECVLRAVTGDRYAVDAALERPELGPTRARYVFELGHRGQTATLTLREGFVVPEFLELLARERGPEDEARLTVLKSELADRAMSAPAAAVFDASG